MALVDRVAARRGVSTDALLSNVFEGQMIKRTGKVALNKEGTADAGVFFRDSSGRSARDVVKLSRADLGKFRAVVKLGKTADFSAFSHEFFHSMERLWFDDAEVALFEKALGKKRAEWSAGSGGEIEYLADQWERYLKTGQAPDEGLAGAFQKLAAAFKRFVREFLDMEKRYGPKYALSPELKAAFDNLLTIPESGLAQAVETSTEGGKASQGEAAGPVDGSAEGDGRADAGAGQDEGIWHTGVKVDASGAGALYHTKDDEAFNGNLDKFMAGDLDSTEIIPLGNPGSNLLAVGIPDLPITLTQSILNKARKDHGVDLATLQSLPSQVNVPIWIFRSSEKSTSPDNGYVIVTEIQGKEGTIAVALHAKKMRQAIEINDIRSIHTKGQEQIGRYYKEGLIIAWDKKKAASDSAAEHFGTTRSIYEAGYVLPDGRMLDFSGRHDAVGYQKQDGKYKAQRDDYLEPVPDYQICPT
ncbi:MAG: hypothetical protein WCQ50_11480 [Spirochaetota bacterium]